MVTDNTDELDHLDNQVFSLINQLKSGKKADIKLIYYQV